MATHWSVQALTPDYPLQKIEVAGTYEQIGYALGKWYQDRGFSARPLTDDEQELARELLRFYEGVHPSILAQLRGIYTAYGLSLDEANEAIPVSDNKGIRILLPGLVESSSCSIAFTRPELAADGHARLGRNYDWTGAVPDTYLVFSQPEGSYATVVMTAHTPGLTAADGLNSQGLALGFASVRNLGYELPTGPALAASVAYRLILETCANVEEAIALLRSVPITFINPSPDELVTHLLVADRSGASAVVEFLPEGIVVSRSDAPYQVMTNSLWAGPADQPDCPRYRTAVERLEAARSKIDTEGLMAVMASMHSTTLWTTIYDLEDLSLVLALPIVDPSTYYEFSLADFQDMGPPTATVVSSEGTTLTPTAIVGEEPTPTARPPTAISKSTPTAVDTILLADTLVPPTALPPTHTPVPDVPEPADLTSLTGAYLGQNPPGKTPRILAPGIVSVVANFEHSAAVFSPDHREVFWCTNVDWYTDQRVPGNQRLYHMKMIDGTWTAPQIAPFTENIHVPVQRPVFSPDGDYLFFLGEGIYWVDTSFVDDLKPPAVDRLPEASQATISVDTADRVERLRTLSGHSDRVYGLAFSSDGRLLLSGSRDGTLRLWDATTWQELSMFNACGHWAVFFAPDDAHVATEDGSVWHIASGEQVRHTNASNAHVTFSPDGDWMASAGYNAPIELWSTADWQIVRTLPGHTDRVFGLAFSPDSALLASGSGMGPSDVSDFAVKVWDVARGEELRTLSGHSGDVHAVAFSPDGELLASASIDYTVRLWDIASGQPVHILRHRNGLYGVAFSPDGSLVASAGCDRTVKLWHVESDRMLRSLPHDDEVMAVAFSPNGTLLVSGGYDHQIYLWGVSR